MRRESLWQLLFLCGILLLSSLLNAQNNRREYSSPFVKQILEKIFNNSNQEENSSEEYFSELSLYLNSIENKGLLMNVKGIEELESYGLLSSFEAASLKSYYREYSEPLSFAELLLIPGLDKEKIKLLKPLLRFYNSYNINEGPSRFYSTLLLRSSITPNKNGYKPITKEEYASKPESRYLGSPILLYGQYRLDAPKNIQAIFTVEKDPGEKGLDYISWNCSIKNRGVLENFIIGSYTARKGQGLILWNGFSINSSWDASSSIKRDYGITPYTSSQEDRAFKGIAATISRGCLSLDLLTSFRNYDARITEDGYTSLLTTGLHNTPLTVQRKSSLHTNMFATCIGYNNEIFSSGIIVSTSWNSLPYAGRDSSILKMEHKMGRNRVNAGINWKYLAKSTIISGELAVDMCGNVAAVSGVAVRLKSGAELSFTGKYYNPLYLSPLSYLSKIPGNDRVLTTVSGKFLLSKSVQLFTAATLAQNYYKAVIKCDILSKTGGSNQIRFSLYKDRLNLRADYLRNLSSTVLFHSRVDFTSCKSRDGFSLGYLIQQELVSSFLEQRVGVSCRISWFDAPLWGNRIYSYERDVLNQFRTTVIYGKGFRWYINMKGSIGSKVDAWLKYSSTYYLDRDKVGEGPEEISGPSKRELKVELRVKF